MFFQQCTLCFWKAFNTNYSQEGMCACSSTRGAQPRFCTTARPQRTFSSLWRERKTGSVCVCCRCVTVCLLGHVGQVCTSLWSLSLPWSLEREQSPEAWSGLPGEEATALHSSSTFLTVLPALSKASLLPLLPEPEFFIWSHRLLLNSHL